VRVDSLQCLRVGIERPGVEEGEARNALSLKDVTPSPPVIL
jgi:hypothetical protein